MKAKDFHGKPIRADGIDHAWTNYTSQSGVRVRRGDLCRGDDTKLLALPEKWVPAGEPLPRPEAVAARAGPRARRSH